MSASHHLREPRVVVAGHICLDITPTFEPSREQTRIEPGQLYRVGPAQFSTGGVVSNTGLALHRLGIPTRLIGKVADDVFGQQILSLLRAIDPALAVGMTITPNGHSSYSVVVSPPGVDRSFIHSPGTNDTFVSSDVDRSAFANAELLHFGYPPVMRQIYENNGAELRELFTTAHDAGLETSLDLCMPDLSSEAGEVSWPQWLRNVLPQTDLFLPSLEEIAVLLGRDPSEATTEPAWCEIADELLEMGTKVVVLKLGERGLYLKSSSGLKDGWSSVTRYQPSFPVHVANTNGAGDCAIAGFLAAYVLQNRSPTECLRLAAAVGAYSVESSAAVRGIPLLAEVQRRIETEWT